MLLSLSHSLAGCGCVLCSQFNWFFCVCLLDSIEFEYFFHINSGASGEFFQCRHIAVLVHQFHSEFNVNYWNGMFAEWRMPSLIFSWNLNYKLNVSSCFIWWLAWNIIDLLLSLNQSIAFLDDWNDREKSEFISLLFYSNEKSSIINNFLIRKIGWGNRDRNQVRFLCWKK